MIVVLDVKKRMLNKEYEVCIQNSRKNTKRSALKWRCRSGARRRRDRHQVDAQRCRLRAVDPRSRLDTVRHSGWCWFAAERRELVRACRVFVASPGSLFVFNGVYKAVLINYPYVAQRDD
jgi:cyclase